MATQLNSDEILRAEFDYIAQTAFQANEDRARVSSFYLVAVGSVIAALFSAQYLQEKFDPHPINILFGALFFILTTLGTTTMLQLARLRVAWFESMLAMNQIKEYFISNDKEIGDAFKWRGNSMPKVYKKYSVSFWQAVEVAILCGLTFSVGVFFLQQEIPLGDIVWNWILTIVLGLLAARIEMWLYKIQLQNEQKRLQAERK